MASDIKTSHLCCLSRAALVFDTTSPSAKACAAGTSSSGQSSEPRLAPPRHGSLTPARISRGPPSLLDPHSGGGWDWTEVSLSLTESLRYSLPSAVLRTDGTARHLIWPSLIDVGQPGCQNRTEMYGCLRSQPCAVHLQVVLAHPPESLAPFSKGPVRKVFRWLGIRFSRNPRGEIIQPPHY